MIKKKEKELLILARKVFKNKKLSINDTPEKVKNWDSMQHLKFLAEVQKRFKKKITFQQGLTIKRVKDFLKFI
tara:strand:+ start:136 stop:354 length:219 start_codon:yes stop_codon:yes gene_type:complete